jgi:ATP adenylyltransferase
MHLEGGAGIPDAWSRLWAPHRMDYLKGENRPLEGNSIACPFCTIPSLSDEDGLIVHRGNEAYVVMNLYPYNAGHLLVCAYRHVADLTDLSESERNEIYFLSAQAMKTIRKVSGAAGFNLVPRWGGDANFMPIIGQTKVLPQLLAQTRSDLAAGWITE